jgi:hypothetical protein
MEPKESPPENQHLEVLRQDKITDWSGSDLVPASRYVSLLFPSCIVRLVIRNPATGTSEAVYFEITRIKDGTFWGEALDTYRLDNFVGGGMALGARRGMSWRREHINEIPLDWQPRRFRKSVAGLEGLKVNRVLQPEA